MNHADEKRISCKRCQTRKIKCSRTSPCRKCSSAGVRCEYRDYDSKRAPISREYVTALESRIASLELFLSRLKSTPRSDRNRMIEEINLIDHLGGNCMATSTDGDSDEVAMGDGSVTECWRKDEDGTMVYHGSSSVYNTQIMRCFESQRASPPLLPAHEQTGYQNIPRDPMIEKCLELFFRWQHPSFPVIDRDAFLIEFSSTERPRRICSPALVYAMSALGALMSSESEVRGMADIYSAKAQKRLNPSDQRSSVPSIQASIFCAIYEAGQGNTSKAWLYSGMALHMKQLGRQPNPTDTYLEGNKSGTSPGDPDTWRRMHTNCYISDKIFGLFFGRAAVVKEVDIEFGVYNSTQSTSVSSSVIYKQSELARIIHDMLAFMFDPKQQQTKRWTATSLTQFNTRLCGWHDALPTGMRWNKWGSCFDEVDPGTAALHMLYHTTRLSLNRHFLQVNGNPSSGVSVQPISLATSDSTNICLVSVDIIVSILHRYKAQYGLKNCPLVFVHGAIIAADVSLTIVQCRENGTPVIDNPNLPALTVALDELSCSWRLARDARIGIQMIQQEILVKGSESEDNTSLAFGSDYESLELIPTPEQDRQNFGTSHSLDLELSQFDGNISMESQFVGIEDFCTGLDVWGQLPLTGNEAMCWWKSSDTENFSISGGLGNMYSNS